MMIPCAVNLVRLTEEEINEYTFKETSVLIGRYNMRQQPIIESRLDRDAKYKVKYSSSTDYSSDESYSR